VTLEPQKGLAAVLAVVLGSISYDGLSEGSAWGSVEAELSAALESAGLGPASTAELTGALGLAGCILALYGPYRLGVRGIREAVPSRSSEALARAFLPSLVPIAFGYTLAHYLSRALHEGQAIASLASDPLGHGWNLAGTASWGIDYGLIPARGLVLPGRDSGRRARGRARGRARPQPQADTQPTPGGPRPILDARCDDRPDEPGPVAAGAIERVRPAR
jgi:hypothetical protein